MRKMHPGNTQQHCCNTVTDALAEAQSSDEQQSEQNVDVIAIDINETLTMFRNLIISGTVSRQRFVEIVDSFKERFSIEYELRERKKLEGRFLLGIRDELLFGNGARTPAVMAWAKAILEHEKEIVSNYEREMESLKALQLSMEGMIPCTAMNGEMSALCKAHLVFRPVLNRIYEAHTAKQHSSFSVLPANRDSRLGLGAICAVRIPDNSDKWMLAVYMGPTRVNSERQYVFDIGDDSIACESGKFYLLANVLVDNEPVERIMSPKMHLLTFIRHTMGVTFFDHPEEVEKHGYDYRARRI